MRLSCIESNHWLDKNLIKIVDVGEAEVIDEAEVADEEPLVAEGEGILESEDLLDDEEDEGTGAKDVDIHAYFPEAQISAGKVAEVLVSVRVSVDSIPIVTG